jgi:hypothetical protein
MNHHKNASKLPAQPLRTLWIRSALVRAVTNMILNFNVRTAGHRLLWTPDHDKQTAIFTAKSSASVPGVIQIQRGLLGGSAQTDEAVIVSLISCDSFLQLRL